MPLRQYRRPADLPETLAVFPLDGAVLFPRWQLPLNIFEPRYLNMIDDTMSGSRLIGMVQTTGGPRNQPNLANVGCVGRVTSYGETDDGRYLITLTGICRFGFSEELEVQTPYRQVKADYAAYEDDLREPVIIGGKGLRKTLETALEQYAEANEIQADWEAVEKAPLETLVHALAAGCPFEPIERQALLEAEDLNARCDALIKLLTMNCNPEKEGPLQ
ncbi:MAG: LON peptidase substrate-binding domain-containing protein [Pseudomonadota bacterium]